MNFNKTIKIQATKAQAYDAVTSGIRNWWGNSNATISKVGDQFSIFFEEETEWRFEATVLDQFNEVRWKCIYADHHFSNLKDIEEEWLDSEIVFTFKDLKEDTIELNFEHQGLTPKLNCYEICDAGWTHFICTSLKQYLETGKGVPNLVE